MALPNWLTVSPTSGSGDGTLSISGTPNTGRSQRSYGNGTSTGVKVTAGSITKYIKVTQAAKAEFVSFSRTDWSVAYNATSVIVTGTSNSKRLTFKLVGNTEVTQGATNCQMKFWEGNADKGVSYKSETAKYAQMAAVSSSDKTVSYTAAGSPAKSGTDIDGDPGNTGEYTFSITITFNTANTGSTKEQITLTATGYSGGSNVSSSCYISRNAASVFLNLGSTSVDLVKEGTAKTVSIDSNGSWEVSGT